jgi:hypothetical protein
MAVLNGPGLQSDLGRISAELVALIHGYPRSFLLPTDIAFDPDGGFGKL